MWCDYVACPNLVFQDNGMVVGSFLGSYNDLWDKPTTIGGGASKHYETLSFFPDKSLTLTAASTILSIIRLGARSARRPSFLF